MAAKTDIAPVNLPTRGKGATFRRSQEDPAWVRWSLTLAAVAVILVLIGIPVVNVFAEALADGVAVYW